jgi:hypothetical protein
MALTNDDKQWIKGAIADGVVEALETVVLSRFDEHDKRFDRIEARLGSVEKRLESLESDVCILKQDVSALKQDVNALKQDMHGVKDRLDTLEWQVEALTNDIKEIYAVIYKKPNRALVSKNFEKLSTEDKITIMHEELLKIAKHENVTLA